MTGVALLLGAVTAAAQPIPRPFPRPGERPPPSAPAGDSSARDQAAPAASMPPESRDAPTEETLGFPIYPNARYITSYDAGRGQRYYLFGTNASFQDMVNYYAIVLDERGDRVFDEPPVHMFEVGRFREQTMAFPPGVTIKNFAWDGSAGFANPTPGGQPSHYRTVIQIVPSPARVPVR